MDSYLGGPTSNVLGITDLVLQPAFMIGTLFMSYTLLRLFAAVFVFVPVYVLVKSVLVLPNVIGQCRLLMTASGRSLLQNDADSQREREEGTAQQRLAGTFRFTQYQLITVPKAEVIKTANWYPQVEALEVCGAMVNVVHEILPVGLPRSGQAVLLLHGNPS